MASSMSTCLLLLLVALIASSYLGHVLVAANSDAPIVSISASGRVFCTNDGNPNRSCGNLNCPPAVNATVSLAVEESPIVLANLTTSATGTFQFSTSYNTTNPAPITRGDVNEIVVYVNIPVPNCPALAGAGVLKASTSSDVRDGNVMLNVRNSKRF